MQIRYEKDLSHNYIVLEKEDIKASDYRYRMLEAQNAPGLMPCSIRQINGLSYLYYKADSCRSIYDRYYPGKMKREDYIAFLGDLADTCKDMRQYLLEEDWLILTRENVLISLMDGRYRFICCPDADEDADMASFGELLIDLADREDRELVNLLYEFDQLLCEGGWQLSALAEHIRKKLQMGMEEAPSDMVVEPVRGAFPSATPAKALNGKGSQLDKIDISEASHLREPGLSGREAADEQLRAASKKDNNAAARRSIYEMDEEDTGDLRPTSWFIYSLCALLISAAGFYIRTNYILSQRENILSLVVMGATAIASALMLAMGIRAAVSGKDPEAKKERIPAGIRRKGPQPSLSPVNVPAMQAASADHIASHPAAVRMTSMDLQPAMDTGRPAGSVEEEDAATTCLNIAPVQQGCLYSKGLDRCIRINLDRLPLTIGKMEGGVDYCLPFGQVSRIHARISRDSKGELNITDLGSTNGSYRNGKRLQVQEAARIVPGDEIRIADIAFELG
ncbi:DUF6382 domain-containing protein [Butyrivibrio sp. MC2013]|uniref:DUF6382 domain-containing protein n=1 Tax=Butyrivibrio sp. MC2013 TaxID=1280686 RepID=UPI000427A546|nr:DUF6382 domain-containing protein [Butyrivibrio sp. MC2013]